MTQTPRKLTLSMNSNPIPLNPLSSLVIPPIISSKDHSITLIAFSRFLDIQPLLLITIRLSSKILKLFLLFFSLLFFMKLQDENYESDHDNRSQNNQEEGPHLVRLTALHLLIYHETHLADTTLRRGSTDLAVIGTLAAL